MRSNIIPTMGAIKYLALVACLALAQADEDLPILDGETREVLYKAGYPVFLRCGVIGEIGKDVKFSWLKDGKPFGNNDKTVFVPESHKDTIIILDTIFPNSEHEGIYRCLAETETGTASSGPIYVKKTYLEVPKVEVKKHTPIEGEPFELDCPEVKAYPKPQIVWMYQHGFDSNISHTILDRRITTGPNGKLYFSNVTHDDANSNFKYVCMATSPALSKPVPLAEHYIIDLKKNTKTGFQPLVPQYLSKDVVGKVGEVTMLYCIYGGTPLAFPDWYLKGTNIDNGGSDRVTSHNRSSGKRLLIRDTRVTDEGTYYCHVVDSQGKNTSHPINVKVIGSPTFVKKPEPKILVKEGQDLVTIPCQVQAIPKPTITWSFNGKHLTTYARMSDANGLGLQIKKIDKSDQGYYGCTATNENGVAYAESLLIVK